MVNHTKAFYKKQKKRKLRLEQKRLLKEAARNEKKKQIEIQEKLRLEEKHLLKESRHNRNLKRKREKYKAMKNANGAEYQSYLEEQKIYRKKYKLKKAKDKEERVIEFLGKRNWRKIKVEGKRDNYYVVDDGHIYNERLKEIGYTYPSGYAATSFGMIHRIIWEAFKGKIPEGYEIDHINTVRNDNRLENLRLVTHKGNCNNSLSIEHYKQHNKTVDRTYLKKFTITHFTKYYDIVQTDLENNIIAKYKTTKDIPYKYGRSMIYDAIKGKLKTAYGCFWKAKIKG